MNTFVKNNIELIFQRTVQHPLLFEINHIYEKLIQINRDMKKMEKLARRYGINGVFPKYEVDLEMNKEVEMEMLTRKEEKKEFFSNKAIIAENERRGEYNCYLEEAELDVGTSRSFLMLNDEEV